MAREHTVKVSDEELDGIRQARERIYGTDSVALGKVIDALRKDDETVEGELVDASVDEDDITEIRTVDTDECVLTNTIVGEYHKNYDGRKRGIYPRGLDPDDFIGMMRRFTGKNIQYLRVMGDLSGHAVYETINEGESGYGASLNSMPWDEFIEKTARVNPDAPNTPDDDPARTVVRTDFDRMRARRDEEIRTGCTCLPEEEEACENCGGNK